MALIATAAQVGSSIFEGLGDAAANKRNEEMNAQMLSKLESTAEL